MPKKNDKSSVEATLYCAVRQHTLTQTEVRTLSLAQLIEPRYSDWMEGVEEQITLLHLVARYGTLAMVLWVLSALESEGADVKRAIAYPSEEGNTVLHEVVAHGTLAMLKLFLKRLGCSAGTVCAALNNAKETVLHQVAQDMTHRLGQPGLLLILSALGQRVKAIALQPEVRGWTPLLTVTRNQGEASVQLMLAALEDVAQAACLQSNEGWTALHIASRYQSWATVNSVLHALGEKTREVFYKQNNKGWTPQHLMAHYHPEVVCDLTHYPHSQVPPFPQQAYLECALDLELEESIQWLAARAAEKSKAAKIERKQTRVLNTEIHSLVQHESEQRSSHRRHTVSHASPQVRKQLFPEQPRQSAATTSEMERLLINYQRIRQQYNAVLKTYPQGMHSFGVE